MEGDGVTRTGRVTQLPVRYRDVSPPAAPRRQSKRTSSPPTQGSSSNASSSKRLRPDSPPSARAESPQPGPSRPQPSPAASASEDEDASSWTAEVPEAAKAIYSDKTPVFEND